MANMIELPRRIPGMTNSAPAPRYLVTITDSAFDRPVERAFAGPRARLDAAAALRACSQYPSFRQGRLVRVESGEVLKTIIRKASGETTTR